MVRMSCPGWATCMRSAPQTRAAMHGGAHGSMQGLHTDLLLGWLAWVRGWGYPAAVCELASSQQQTVVPWPRGSSKQGAQPQVI